MRMPNPLLVVVLTLAPGALAAGCGAQSRPESDGGPEEAGGAADARADGGSGEDGSADGDPSGDGSTSGDPPADTNEECAPMDAREGPATCDGGGTGYRWDGSGCVYQGDLCNCIGQDCDSLFATAGACRAAYAACLPDPTGCDALRESLVLAFEAAVRCNPAMSSLQCTDDYLIRNVCGCNWAANNRYPELAAAALAAWEAFESAACVGDGCPPCPEPTPEFACTVLPAGTDGTCEPRS